MTDQKVEIHGGDKLSLPVGQKCDRETAERDFSRFAKAWRIYDKVDEMTMKDRESFEEEKAKLIDAIIEGILTVGSDGNMVYKLIYPHGACEQLDLKRPLAMAFFEMDKYPDDQKIKKSFAYVAAMTGQSVPWLGTLDGVDIKVPIAVAGLFLGS